MEPALSTPFPPPPVCVMGWLSGNPRLGFRVAGNTLHQGLNAGKYLIAVGDTASVVPNPWLESLKAQQQSSNYSSNGTGFWSHVGNLLHGHSWNYRMRESVTMTIEPESESEPNPYVAVGTDALGVVGAATDHPGLGYVGSAISLKNDLSAPNLVMTGMSFVPFVGEAVGAVTAVQDVGMLAGKWITNNVMSPTINAIPGNTMDNGNGISIPTPEAQCVASGMC
jgi:hypothetical protein